jgi:hypothetical protein
MGKQEFKSRVYTDRPPYADFDAPHKFEAIKSIVAKRLIEHPNAICSYSGGADSDILIDVIERTREIFSLPPVKYAFFNTGLALRKLDEQENAKTPCDLCRYNPPSSRDGKPCTMCPASPVETNMQNGCDFARQQGRNCSGTQGNRGSGSSTQNGAQADEEQSNNMLGLQKRHRRRVQLVHGFHAGCRLESEKGTVICRMFVYGRGLSAI